VNGIAIDTAFFTGNQTPYVSIQGACLGSEHEKLLAQLAPRRANHLGSAATPEECASISALQSDAWEEVLAVTKLQPGYPDTRRHLLVPNPSIGNKRFTHLRINMFPDGGIARLRIHGQVLPDWSNVKATDIIDLAALENG
jgi:allantoicase